MRHLAQPRVLISAATAALATALAGYPRLSLWLNRSYPLWYLEALLFFGATVLWGFVFAWHTHYTHRPVLTLKLEYGPLIVVTLAGIAVATVFHLFLDPTLRLKMPEDYPTDRKHWLAMVSFTLAFSQLFLVFAPFAWLIRLFQNRRVATVLTVLFGAVVLTLKTRSPATPISSGFFAVLLMARIGLGFLSISFYLRGGVILSWWWTFLIEARHWFFLADNS